MAIRTLNEDDLPALFKLREVAFGLSADPDDEALLKNLLKRLPYSRGYFVNDKLAANVTFHPFKMYLAGNSVRMGGLAGVMSNPEFRRRGHIKALLHDGLERLRFEGVGWCLEYPFDPNYYQRFGWQSVENGFRFDLPSKLLAGKETDAERLEPGDLDKLKPIYEAFAKNYNFALTRENSTRPGWSRIVREPYEKEDRIIYLLEDAYCIFSLKYDEGSRVFNYLLNVRDYAFSSPEGRRNLFAFLGRFQGQANNIKIHLPVTDPLRLDAQNYLQHNGCLQARVVDVKLALEAFKAQQETSFVIAIQDDFCDWNKRSFNIIMEAGKVAVSETAASPHLSLDIRTLVLLLSGTLSAEAVQQLGLAEGNSQAMQALQGLAGRRSSFMPQADFF